MPSASNSCCAREARHRQLGLGQRQRGQIGIVAHVGDDAGDDRGLPRLVLADRGVFRQHMRHLVAQHRGQFGGVAGERDQAARHIELAGRQRERVHRAGIEDGHLVGLVGTIGGRDQPVDGLADQRFQLRIVIGAAIGGQDALMLALAGGRLRHRAVRLDRRRRPTTATRSRNRPMSPQAESVRRGAQQGRRSQKAAACPSLAPSCTLSHVSYSSCRTFSRLLIPAEHFNLPHPEHLDPRPTPRLDKAADTNPSIFEGLRRKPSRLERRHHAP